MSPFLLALAVALPDALALPQEPTRPRLVIERELAVRGGASQAVAWSQDGRWVASAGVCGDVRVLDAATGALRQELPGELSIGALRFSPDGGTLLTVGTELAAWSLATGAVVAHRQITRSTALDWSRDGTRIAAIDATGCVTVLRAADLTPIVTFALPDGAVVDSLAFSADATRLTIGRRDGGVFVGDTTSGRVQAGGDPAPTAASTHDGAAWVVGDDELVLHRGTEVLRRFPLRHRSQLSTCVLTADGRHAVVGSGTSLFAFRTDDGTPIPLPATVRGAPIPYDAGPELLVWSPATASTPSRLVFWSIDALTRGRIDPVRTIDLPPADGAVLDERGVTRDGRYAAWDGAVFDLLHMEVPRWRFDHRERTTRLPSPDGARVARVDVMPNWLSVTDVYLHAADGSAVGPRTFTDVWSTTWSPDGKKLAVTCADQLLLLDGHTLDDVDRIAGTWRAFVWLDDASLLLTSDRDLVWMPLADPAAAVHLPITGAAYGIAVDRAGRRAIVMQNDRALLVRIER